MKKHIKKGDTVKLISGDGRSLNRVGEVVAISKDSSRVTVEGIKEKTITKHIKPRSAQQKGGRVEMPGTVDISNLMIVCPDCNTPTRVAKKIVEVDGKEVKARICKRCGANLDIKKASAKKTKRKAKKKEAVETAPQATEATASKE